MKKRVLAYFLSATLVVGLMPATAWAEELPQESGGGGTLVLQQRDEAGDDVTPEEGAAPEGDADSEGEKDSTVAETEETKADVDSEGANDAAEGDEEDIAAPEEKPEQVAMVALTEAEPKATGVAMIGDKSYETLAAAVADVPTDGTETTIVLTNNISNFKIEDIVTIPDGANVILDMDGKSITATSDFEGRPIVNEGTLKVTGDGTIDSSASVSGGYGAINNKGTLTIIDGTYRGAIYASGSAIRNTGADAELVIKDGTFDGATCAVYNEGTVRIDGGDFIGKTCSSCNSKIWSYTIQNATVASNMTINGGYFQGTQGAVSASIGKLTVNDGTFKTVDCSQNHGAIFHALYAAGENGEVECIINGGHFETEGKNAAVRIGNDNTNGDGGINAPATAYIKGGTFVAPEGVPALQGAEKTGDPVITGGTFTSDVSEYLPKEGGYSIKEVDGKYVVDTIENHAAAKIGDDYYNTLAEAVENANTNDTITLLKSVDGSGIKIDTSKKSITFDLNDKTYTITNPTVGSPGTETNGFQLLKGGSVTFKNGTLKPGTGAAAMLIQNYCDLTLENVTIDCRDSKVQDALSNNCGNVTIKGNTNIYANEGQYAFDLYYWPTNGHSGVTVTFDDTFTGTVKGVIGYDSDDTPGHAEKAVLKINGQGNFDGKITTRLKDANIKISGGYFTFDPTAYLADGHFVTESDKEGYFYKVTDEKPAEPPVFVTEEVKSEVSESIDRDVQQAIEDVINKTEVTGIAQAVKPEAKQEIVNKSNAVIVENDTVEIEVTVNVTATGADLRADGENFVTFEVTPAAVVKVNGQKSGKAVPVPNDYLDGDKITVKLPVPNGLTVEEVEHTCADGSKEFFYKTGNKRFTEKDGVITIEITKFSEIKLSGTVSAMAQIGDQYYATLQEAIDHVKNGETIKLVNDCDEEISVRSRISFTLDENDVDWTGSIEAGSRYRMRTEKDGEKTTYTFTKKKSSSSSSSSDREYKVTIADDIENGKVKADPTKAEKGDKVTITVTPKKGYEISKVYVKDEDGDKLELKDRGDGEYTFTMPNSEVEVKATFTKAEEEKPVEPEEIPADEKIILTINQRIARVFGNLIVNDVAPIIQNDRTMLPIRFIAQNLGAEVTWDEQLWKVTIAKEELKIEIIIGSPIAFVNGETVTLDAPAFIENSRTYLPLRFVAENLGATVLWDAKTQEVTIIPEKAAETK